MGTENQPPIENCDFSDKEVTQSFAGRTIQCKGDFKNARFPGKAEFGKTRFLQGADFTGAVFEGDADFSEAVFMGGDVLFDGAVFLGNADFSGAKFGEHYERFFGDWEIWFEEKTERGFFLKRRNKGENAEPEKLGCILGKGYKREFPELWGMEAFLRDLTVAFGKFKENPGKVSFQNCRFGEKGISPPLEGGAGGGRQGTSGTFSEAEKPTNAEVNFRGARFDNRGDVIFNEALFLNGGHVRFDSTYWTNGGKVSFYSASWANGKEATFARASWSNGGNVVFGKALWSNGASVLFFGASWANGGHVGFNSASWSNGGDVVFNSASWSNGRNVHFEKAAWSNRCGVKFEKASWSNGGDVRFDSASFTNGANVGFERASWINRGEISLSQMVWANAGVLGFPRMRFDEEKAVKFDECLFLSKEGIAFLETRFPEKGSTMFQRCYFARTPEVDFTGAFFRHTSFEGGEISWLKKPREVSKQEEEYHPSLSERLGEKYDRLPQEVKKKLEKFQSEKPDPSPVFEGDVKVLWKDLTTESAKHLTLRRVNLSHSLFDGMTLSHVQLNAPEWSKEDGRHILYGEQKLGKNPSLENLRDIEDQYTQLKNNLERQGNYLHAGDFHYGEQEIRREILKRKRPWWKSIHNFPTYFLATLYKWSSGYGERWGRAIFMTFLLAGTLTLYNGLEQGFMGLDTSHFFSNGPIVLKVLLHSLSPFTWKAILEKGYLDSSNWYHYTVFFFWQIILLAIQLPLLVMAVRRRFKR